MLHRMVCREPLVDGPVVLGSKTLRALGSGFWFGEQTGLEGPWVRKCLIKCLDYFMSWQFTRDRKSGACQGSGGGR